MNTLSRILFYIGIFSAFPGLAVAAVAMSLSSDSAKIKKLLERAVTVLEDELENKQAS